MPPKKGSATFPPADFKAASDVKMSRCSGSDTYEANYVVVVERVLKPLFFVLHPYHARVECSSLTALQASIGFSVSISRMFTGSVLWQGLVYATLMAFGKVVCGLRLIRLSMQRPTPKKPKFNAWAASIPLSFARPKSLYPASMLGCAMIARGEIGFLVSAIANSDGIFATSDASSDGTSDIFLAVTWAIVLCTIVGPVGLGLLVRRVRRLQEQGKKEAHSREDPLGIWGLT